MPELPEVEVVMATAFGSVNLAVEATKLGRFDFIEKPLNHDHFDIVIKNAAEKALLRRENDRLREERRREAPPDDFVGESDALVEIRRQIVGARFLRRQLRGRRGARGFGLRAQALLFGELDLCLGVHLAVGGVHFDELGDAFGEPRRRELVLCARQRGPAVEGRRHR